MTTEKIKFTTVNIKHGNVAIPFNNNIMEINIPESIREAMPEEDYKFLTYKYYLNFPRFAFMCEKVNNGFTVREAYDMYTGKSPNLSEPDLLSWQ